MTTIGRPVGFLLVLLCLLPPACLQTARIGTLPSGSHPQSIREDPPDMCQTLSGCQICHICHISRELPVSHGWDRWFARTTCPTLRVRAIKYNHIYIYIYIFLKQSLGSTRRYHILVTLESHPRDNLLSTFQDLPCRGTGPLQAW